MNRIAESIRTNHKCNKVMNQDKLSRRGGGGGTPTPLTKEPRPKDQQQQTVKEKLQAQPQSSTQSDVAQSLKDAMPRMLRRFLLSTLLFACIAVGAAFYFPTEESQLLASGNVKIADRLVSAPKYAQTQQLHTVTGQPSVQVLAKYPHDSEAFTQGLLVATQGQSKFFIESTGLFGQSTLRKVAIETGEVLGKYDLPKEIFGEGVTLTKDTGELVMLTWKSRKGFVFQAQSDASAPFALEREFEFSTTTGEGWGIDSDGDAHLIVSDGSSTLIFWDPATLKEVRRIDVKFRGHAIAQLNELEFANGFIYANIWYEKLVAKIDPTSGEIVAVFDCSALADARTTGDNHGAVLNGIAYDGDEDVFYLTGKLWNAVYKVRLLE